VFEVGEDDFEGEGEAVEQIDEVLEVFVGAIFGQVVFVEDAVGEDGSGFGVEATEVVQVVAEGLLCQPVFRAS
jgi:hypothetical protein